MANQFQSECEALLSALAQGVTSVTYRDRTIQFDDMDGIIARLQFLGCIPNQNWRNRGVSPDTSKGLNGKCGCDE